MYETLEELLMIPGISGYEGRVRELIKQKLPDDVETTTDNMGNLVATVGEGDKQVLFVAHMDELGFIVTEVQDNGFLKIKPYGGTDPRTLFGRVLRFITRKGEVKGVVGVIPPHLMADRDKEMSTIPQITDFQVDVGASSGEEAEEMGLRVLDFGVMEKTFNIIADKYLCARALDDRLGCWLLLRALESIKKKSLNARVHIAFSVQEEVGVRGAQLLAKTLGVDMAFAVDSASSGDIPQARKDLSPSTLGKGPAFRVMDRGAIIPSEFVEELTALVEKTDIPFQVIFTGGGTDVRAFQLEPPGPKVMPLAFPVRYTHSGVEMVHKDDAENMLRLIDLLIDTYAC